MLNGCYFIINKKPGNSFERIEKFIQKKLAFSTCRYPDDGIQVVATCTCTVRQTNV